MLQSEDKGVGSEPQRVGGQADDGSGLSLCLQCAWPSALPKKPLLGHFQGGCWEDWGAERNHRWHLVGLPQQVSQEFKCCCSPL